MGWLVLSTLVVPRGVEKKRQEDDGGHVALQSTRSSASVGVGGKEQNEKTTSNNRELYRQRVSVFFFFLPGGFVSPREGPYSSSAWLPLLCRDSCTTTTITPTLILIHTYYTDVCLLKVTATNCTRMEFIFWIICAWWMYDLQPPARLFWFRWLKSFASVERMIAFNDDDQLESQSDRYIYSVDSR